MSAQHTPGPWTVEQDERPGMAWNRHIHAGPDVAVCFLAHSDGKAPERDKANARLIASAPELLAALESANARLLARMHTDSADDYNAYSAACAAIAKATRSES